MKVIRLRQMLAMTAGLMAESFGGHYRTRGGKYSTPKTGHQRRSKYVQHQGKGEIARRKARIVRGLVSPVYSAADPFVRVA